MKSKSLIYGLLISLIFVLLSGCGINKIVPGLIDSDKKETTDIVRTDATAEEQTTSETTEITTTDNISQTEPEKPKIDYTKIYTEVLDSYYNLILSGSEDYQIGDGKMGLLEAISFMETNDALASVGYAIQDISEDGIPELLIVAIAEKDNSVAYGNVILAIYTCVNDEPVFSFEGRARSSYRYIGDADFFYQGSNGAIYSIFGTYTLTPDGLSLTCNDYFFSYEKDDNFQEIGFYHNNSGIWDKSVSEELAISDEEFWQIESDLLKQIQNIELIPFSQHSPVSEATDTIGSEVNVHWAEDVLDNSSVYDEFSVEQPDPEVRVVFTTENNLQNFKILELELDNIDDLGNISFLTRELFALDELTSERFIVANLTYFETIPQYGIAYIDRSGTTRYFALELSGKDGSLLLSEFRQ